MNLTSQQVGAAVRAACLGELLALKPGNVHRHADGHGMTAADFEASAEAVAATIADPGLGVGERILAAVRATRAAVGCNTNLGIVLLAAPLVQAALAAGGGSLRDKLRPVLAGLTLADADRAFQAILLAEPAGLGHSDRHDVREAARVSLRDAMTEAAGRDRVARQYASDYADIFELGLPWLRAALETWRDEPWATARVYLGFLARFPDSHITRKHGAETAEDLCRRAAPLADKLAGAEDPAVLTRDLLAFDRALKAEGLNPGTSADLTVATLLAQKLEDMLGGATGPEDR